MRWLVPSLLLAFLVFPGWNHKRPLKRQRGGSGRASRPALSFERAGTVRTPSTQAQASASEPSSMGGPPALKLVSPATNTDAPSSSDAAPTDASRRSAVVVTGGTDIQLVQTAFAQLRPAVFGTQAVRLLDSLERLTVSELERGNKLHEIVFGEDGAA